MVVVEHEHQHYHNLHSNEETLTPGAKISQVNKNHPYLEVLEAFDVPYLKVLCSLFRSYLDAPMTLIRGPAIFI